MCSENAKEVTEIAWMHLHIYAMHFRSTLVATRAASPGEAHGLATLLPVKDSDSPQP